MSPIPFTVVRQQLPVFVEFTGLRPPDSPDGPPRHDSIYINLSQIIAFHPCRLPQVPNTSTIKTVDGETYIIDTPYEQLAAKMQHVLDIAFKGVPA